MKKSQYSHRRRRVPRCYLCQRKITPTTARVYVSGNVICGDCIYWAERGITVRVG